MATHRFVTAVRAAIEREDLAPRAGVMVVACSGGADSLALLAALRDLCGGPGLAWPGTRLHVAHLDHGLRGAAGAADAAFVAAIATGWGLGVTVGTVPAAERATWRGSVEATARTARYRFLRAVAAEQGATTIALGHTADDQAETVLLHLLRGGALDGLSGMRPHAGDLARPLLDLWRRDTVAFCRDRGLAYRDDATNADPRYTRNRVRHELIPLLETYQPRIRATLARNAAVLARDADALNALAAAAWPAVVAARDERRIVLWRAAVRALTPAVRGRILRRAILAVGGASADAHLDASGVARLERVALDTSGERRRVEFATGAQAMVDRERITIEPAPSSESSGATRDPIG